MFDVIEYSAFYAVRHIPSGDEHPMGDGVDTLFNEVGQAISPGTEGFTDIWKKLLNDAEDETLEAYFPQHVGSTNSQYVVVLTAPDGETDIIGPFDNREAAQKTLTEDVPAIDGWDGWDGRIKPLITNDPGKW